ncbi:uncharacterized protein [Palaemon carinicauda]|uniref:uncharacterized protein n=1 Tax=Palaemon carinicauda TaxID=392227 RepID=UPI0035B69C3F
MARSTPSEISCNYECHRDHAAGRVFAQHVVCVELVSDNGRQFVAYHSSSNGQAENTRTPAELIGRQLRTRLDLLYPDASQRIERKAPENEKPMRELDIGDMVLVQDYRQNTKKGIWTRGVVVLKLDPCTYNVQVDGNLIWKRNIDQMRLISNDSQDNKNELLARDFSELVSYPDPPLPK